MIFFIILIVCALGFTIWGFCEEWYGRFDWSCISNSLLGTFLGSCGGLLIGLLVFLVGNVCCGPCTGPIEIQETTELVALKDNQGMEGYGFLFSGGVNDELKYYYIYDEPQKGLTTNSVNAAE